MNAGQKKELVAVAVVLDHAKTEIERIRDDSQEKYDDMSERVQEGEKGEELSGEIEALEEVMNSIEEAEDKLKELTNA